MSKTFIIFIFLILSSTLVSSYAVYESDGIYEAGAMFFAVPLVLYMLAGFLLGARAFGWISLKIILYPCVIAGFCLLIAVVTRPVLEVFGLYVGLSCVLADIFCYPYAVYFLIRRPHLFKKIKVG